MPVSISATINLDPAQIQSLTDVPTRIQELVNTARASLEAVRGGQNTGNPLGSLFSALGELGEVSQQLPSFDSALGPLQQITGRLPDRALADLTAVRGAVDEVLGLFGATKDLVLSGKLDQAFEEGASRVLEVAASRLRPGDEVHAMFQELKQFFQLFEMLLEWRSRTPSAEQVADFLSHLLIGAPRDLLARPKQLVDDALQPLEQLLSGGVDLAKWRKAPSDCAAFWVGVDALFSNESAVDWSKLENDLRAQGRAMLDLRVLRDRLLAETVAALGSIRLVGLSGMSTAVAAVPKIPDFRLSNLLEGLRQQLEAAAADLEAWAPTPDELRRMVRRLGEGLRSFLEHSPLGQLRNLMLDFQHRLLLAIESLPLAALAAKAEGFLREIAHAIDSFDAAALLRPVHEFFATIEQKLQTSAADAIKNAVGLLWKDIEDVFEQINTELTKVRGILEGVVGRLQSLLGQLQPALQAISQSISRIQELLTGFDLLETADQVVGELHQLRDKMAALDVSKLPGPALSALHAGADFLRGLDIAGAVNPPLNQALGKIDPTPLLRQASDVLEGAVGQLKRLDPQSIASVLDKPVDELLGALRDFGPDRLKAMLEAALQPVEDAIRSLDAGKLLAPVSRLFQELTARVDALLNPDLIFAPLEKVFQPVVDLVEAIEPGRLIGLLAPHAEKIGETAGSAAGPPAVMQQAGASLRQAIAAAPEADDPLFGFRPGDLLIPLIDLYRKFREGFDGLDQTVIEPAAKLLRESFHLSLEALYPQAISLRIDTALHAVAGDFEPAGVAARFSAAVDAYHSAARKLGAAARGGLSTGDAVIAERIRALLPDLNPLALVPEFSQAQGILTASISVRASFDWSALLGSVPRLQSLQAFVPTFLAEAESGAAGLKQWIDDLDPARVRTQINEIFDRIGRRMVALQEPLMAGIDEWMGAMEDFLLPISPGHIVELAQRLHAALKEQILAFSPAAFQDEVRLIFDAVKAKLTVFDPAGVAADLNGLRDGLIETLHQMVAAWLPDMGPFVEMQGKIADLKPSRILQPAIAALKPVTDVIAQLDMQALFQPLIDAIERVRLDLPEVVSRIEGALDEVLAAIPEGGPANASVAVG